MPRLAGIWPSVPVLKPFNLTDHINTLHADPSHQLYHVTNIHPRKSYALTWKRHCIKQHSFLVVYIFGNTCRQKTFIYRDKIKYWPKHHGNRFNQGGTAGVLRSLARMTCEFSPRFHFQLSSSQLPCSIHLFRQRLKSKVDVKTACRNSQDCVEQILRINMKDTTGQPLRLANSYSQQGIFELDHIYFSCLQSLLLIENNEHWPA